MIGYIMEAAPIGAFGAMAFTIGKFGVATLLSLGKLLLCVYLTCFGFIFMVLGAICFSQGINFFRFLGYLREEIAIALGTSSSESVLPRLMLKMEHGSRKPRRGGRRSGGLLIQPRRHRDLSHHRRAVRRAGHQHPPFTWGRPPLYCWC